MFFFQLVCAIHSFIVNVADVDESDSDSEFGDSELCHILYHEMYLLDSA